MVFFFLSMVSFRNFLEVQWLALHASTAGVVVSVLGQRTVDPTCCKIKLFYTTGNRLLLPTPIVKQESKDVEENVGLIVYNGAMVDVGSLLQKLEKSEKVRAEVEQKLQLLEEKTGKEKHWYVGTFNIVLVYICVHTYIRTYTHAYPYFIV